MADGWLTMLASPSQGEQPWSRRACVNVPFHALSLPLLSQWLQTEQTTLTALFEAAWAVVLRSYTASDHVAFCCRGTEEMKVDRYDRHITSTTPIRHLLQKQDDPDVPCSCGHDLGADETPDSKTLNTIVYVELDRQEELAVADNGSGEEQCEIIVRISQDQTSHHPQTIEIIYPPTNMVGDQAAAIAKTLNSVVCGIVTHTHQTVGELDLCSDADIAQIGRWHQEAAAAVNGAPRRQQCVHEEIVQRCQEQPGAMAVSAWDGSLSYAELDQQSSMLATYLQGLGVEPERFVALCFDKSKWAIVTVLAILKAGGAYVFLDPAHPVHRTRIVCERVSIHAIVCSPAHMLLAASLSPQVISVSDDNDRYFELHRSANSDAPSSSPLQQSRPTPANALYAVFTSGSTGEPKGVVVSHGAFHWTAKAKGHALSLNSKSRVLQFAATTFSISNRDILMTLLFGGCVCIPSDWDRMNNLALFINHHRVNCASLTPSVAGILSPSAVPSLKTLLLGGEPMTEAHMTTWAGHVRLFNAYGMSETGIAAIANLQPGSSPQNVGFGCGSHLWIVELNNPHRLAPVGAVGELVVQGPGIARQYLGDEQRTVKCFLSHTEWQNRFETEAWDGSAARFYRTGDLGHYQQDGSVQYLGRKDTQINLHGQRLELGEVEYQIRQCVAGSDMAVGNVVVVASSEQQKTGVRLVAFLDCGKPVQAEPISNGYAAPAAPVAEIEIIPREEASPWIENVKQQLSLSLPGYMIPDQFFFVRNMPLMPSGKINRSRLRQISGELLVATQEELSHDDANDGDSETDHSPWTLVQEELRAHWGNALGRPVAKIQRRSHFFRQGGDSISAMKLVASQRAIGWSLTVAGIFNHPTLSEMASILVRISPDDPSNAPSVLAPFVLLDEPQAVRNAVVHLDWGHDRDLSINPEQIEDIYPCTPIQEGLIALTAKTPGAYVSRRLWQLTPTIDLHQFRAAWERVWIHNPILRTRIVQTPLGIFQVVLRDEIPWETVDVTASSQAERAMKKISPPHGRLIQFTVCRESNQRAHFALEIHHALFDAWSLDLIFQQVQLAYRGEPLQTYPFNGFVQHLRHVASNSESTAFWQKEFAGFEPVHFPAPPPVAAQPDSGDAPKLQREEHVLEIDRQTDTAYTVSSAIRLAWAIVLWHKVGSEDVSFGIVTTGRGAAMEIIDQLTGPTVATVPVRIKLAVDQTLEQGLSQVQTQSTNMMAFEQTGLQNIVQAGPEAAAACGFQNLLVIQPRSHLQSLKSGLFSQPSYIEYDNQASFADYPFVLTCQLEEGSILFQAAFNPKLVSSIQARQIVFQIAHVYRQMMDHPHRRLSEIDLITPEDHALLRQWHGDLPSGTDACIHDLIQQRCLAQPDAIALYSLSCQELLNLGIQPGDLVPVFLEKNVLTAVALLAVLKAGAGFVMLETSYPFQRLQEICSNIRAKLVVTSPACTETSRALNIQVLVVEGHAMQQQIHNSSNQLPLPLVSADDPAAVVFTSGSTGKPKGIVLHHRGILTTAKIQCATLPLTSESRMFQFASYAFDASIGDHIFTLLAGGCLCIPTEEEWKNDLIKAARDLQVTIADFTPSMMGLINPADIPTLKTLISGGEPLTANVIKTWADRVRLVNVYGPAECSVATHFQVIQGVEADCTVVGRSQGGISWLVVPDNHHQLVPIGAVGEVVMEGPVVASGYFENPEQTDAGFIESPQWLIDFRLPANPGRLYKTGDLGRYTAEGSLQILGRKDLQVKVNGQRVELGEIEHQIAAYLPGLSHVVVELINLRQPTNRSMLAAFVCPLPSVDWAHIEEDQIDAAGEGVLRVVDSPSNCFHVDIDALRARLSLILPSYMIPYVFFPLAEIPTTRSGKSDRRRLRDEVSSWSPEHIAIYQNGSGAQRVPKQSPVTEQDRQMQQLVATALKLDPGTVWMNSDFFILGGDSITAMRLATLARYQGLSLRVPDIFSHPILSDLVALLAKSGGSHADANGEVTDWTMIPAMDNSTNIHASLSARLPAKISEQIIEVLPTSEFQRMTLTQFYCRYIWISLPDNVDQSRLLHACQQLVKHHSILRTAFAIKPSDDNHASEVVQLVLRTLDVQFIQHDAVTDLAALCAEDSATMAIPTDGQPPFQVHLVRLQHDAQRTLVLRIPHAQFDGLSISVICSDLAAAYNGQSLPPTASFADHIHSIVAKRTREAYGLWRRILQGAEMTSLVDLGLCNNLAKQANETTKSVREETEPLMLRATKLIPLITPQSSITMATVVKTAWGLTLMQLLASHRNPDKNKNSSQDIVFGQVIHGRGLGIAHEDRIVGPCLNIIPVRMHIPLSTATDNDNDIESKSTLLLQVQQQHIETMPHENLGLQEIFKNSTAWPSPTRLSSFVRFQNFDEDRCVLDGVSCATRLYSLPNRPSDTANVLVVVTKTHLEVTMTISDKAVDQKHAAGIVTTLCGFIQDLC